MKKLFHLKFAFILFVVNYPLIAQTITGFGSPTDACGSAPTVNLSPGTSCLPLSGITAYTTNVNMSDASFTANQGVLPNCNGTYFGGVAMTSAMTDKWIRIVTDANTQGMGLEITNVLAVGTNSTTNFNIALYQTSTCPGSGTNPIDIQWSASTPSVTNCNNVSIVGPGCCGSPAGLGTDPYYIDLDPSSTYYMRIYSTTTTGHNDKSFDLKITPFPPPPSNGNNTSTSAPCTNSHSLTATTIGCNYGSLPAPWIIGSNLQLPDGCLWSRAENSNFYRFTRPTGQFTVTISGISCIGGANTMQSIVLSSCPNPGAATTGEFSAQSATTCISSSSTHRHIINDGGTAGSTYYFWVDGTDGAVCTWSVSITSSAGTLPVELTSFESNVQPNKTVKLEWQTATEMRNEKFIVERSENGKDFYAIGEVKGHGTTQEKQDYEFLDIKPKPGILYYRLRQVDYDGKYEIHKTISTEISVDDFIVFPNPAKEVISLSLKNKEIVPEKIELMNYTGEIIEVNLNKEESIYHFDINHLPKGIYFIKAHYLNGVQIKNFIISK